MNSRLRKGIIVLVSATTLGVTLGTTAVSASAYSKTEKVEATSTKETSMINSYLAEEELVSVTLYSDENKTIITEVPESYAEKYIQKLENEEFKQQEIANSVQAKANFQTQSSTVRFMGEEEVLDVLDSMDSSYNWSTFLSNPITDAALARAVQQLTKNSFVGFAVGVLTWGAADLMARQEAWWNDSAMMILRGEISGVRLTITPSGKDYPKVYRTLERV